jgi:hypothetical protein
MADDFRPGRYRHFKGGLYEAFDLARHSETEEEYVIYRPLQGAPGWWVRPRAMFCGTVVVDGAPVPRFAWLGPAAAQREGEAP